jgi:hypothetical protein
VAVAQFLITFLLSAKQKHKIKIHSTNKPAESEKPYSGLAPNEMSIEMSQ